MRISSVYVVILALGAVAACGDGGSEPPPPPGVISLAVGQSSTLSASQAGSAIEVSGGSAGAEFVLIPFHGSQTAGQTVTLQFTGTEITGVSGPPTPDLAPTSGPQLSRAPSADALSAAASFHAQLRRLERGELGARLRAIRAARGTGASPLFSVSAAAATPAVGDQMTLNVNAKDGLEQACRIPDLRTGTVAAVTQFAVIVADNANPSGGFTQADYERIGQKFDALVYPLVTQNFGSPSDIDNNTGRSVIFYTRAVNELTATRSESYIGGFFHPRDLYPKVGPNPNSTEDDCPTSNQAEMFYMLVPDPNGEVNGNVRRVGFVDTVTVGTLGHELQHLINASLRLEKNVDFEELWLNEGLSHIAEELLFYRESGLAPRQNISLATLVGSEKIRGAVNTYQVSNFGRLIEYLEDPEQRSPYAGPRFDDEFDNLATRGAAWQLLRYAADRSTTAEQTLWRSLASSRQTGVTNFASVFGGDFMSTVRDWATAQYTDDVLSTTTALQHPSWRYRDVVSRLVSSQRFPLKTRTLAAGVAQTVTLKGGGAAYLRFGVAGGATGRIAGTSSSGAGLPPTVSLTVVRTR